MPLRETAPHQDDGQTVLMVAIADPTAALSEPTAVVVALRFAGDGCAASVRACLLIAVRSARTWPASAEDAELTSPFSATSVASMIVRSAETLLLVSVLALTLISPTFARAARSALTCAQETERVAAGRALGADDWLAEPAVVPVAPEPHAASKATAPRPAIARGQDRRTGSRSGP
jgi:hypothetical protein